MTVLVTVDDALETIVDDTVQTGPFIQSPSGRNLLAMPSMPFGLGMMPTGLPMIGGRIVSFGDLYRSQPNIAAAINKRYRPIVRLPWRVFELGSQNQKREVTSGRLVDLVARPWRKGSPAALKQQMFAPKLVHGNSLVRKIRDDPLGPPTSFQPLDWRQMAPRIVNGEVVEWRTQQFGTSERIAADDLVWLKWWGPDGFGVSPLEQLGVTVRIDQAAQRSQEAIFLNGGRPPSAIEVGEEFLALEKDERKEALDNLRSDVTLLYTSPENAGRPAVLPPGVTWNPVGHTAVEAQLIEQRKLSREEIDSVLDIAPPLVGVLDKATYSNITTQSSWLYTDILGPDIVMNEQELKAQAWDLEPAFAGQWVEYDLSGVLRGSKLEEIEALREAVATAVLTPNEARIDQGKPPEGDPNDPENPANKLYLPTNNLSPLGAKPPATPTPTPPPPVPASSNGNG